MIVFHEDLQFKITSQEYFTEARATSIDPNSLMVEIEAMHASPYYTRNCTRYMGSCLKNSIKSWTKPYGAPLIKHHNEKNGDIIGRVVAAEYKETGTLSGTPALLLTVNVPNEEAKRDIKNGLLQTVSIGVTSEDVRCSVCGHKYTSEQDMKEHEHERGVIYGAERCTWDFHQMTAKELSFVVVPSDMYAKSVRVYPATDTPITILNSIEQQEGDNMTQQEYDSKVSEYESPLKAATEAKAAAETKIQSLETAAATTAQQITSLESAKAESDKKIEALEAAKSELSTKITDLEAQLQSEKDKTTEDLKMKEGLEKELETVKVALKESMVAHLQALRKLANKPELDHDKAIQRTEASIRDSIQDLLTEQQESVSLPQPLNNPGLVDEDKPESKESHGNIDLKAGLENILMGMARVHS